MCVRGFGSRLAIYIYIWCWGERGRGLKSIHMSKGEVLWRWWTFLQLKYRLYPVYQRVNVIILYWLIKQYHFYYYQVIIITHILLYCYLLIYIYIYINRYKRFEQPSSRHCRYYSHRHANIFSKLQLRW